MIAGVLSISLIADVSTRQQGSHRYNLSFGVLRAQGIICTADDICYGLRRLSLSCNE